MLRDHYDRLIEVRDAEKSQQTYFKPIHIFNEIPRECSSIYDEEYLKAYNTGIDRQIPNHESENAPLLKPACQIHLLS